MRLSPGSFLGRLLPRPLAARLTPQLARLDAIVAGGDDSAVSQRTAVFAFGIRLVSAVIAYFSQVLMARWMGDFEYGIFVAVWVAAVILGGLACLGFQTGVVRFISEYLTARDMDHVRGAVRLALTWSFAASTAMAAFGCGVVFLFADQITNYYVVPIYLAAICLPMMALQEVQDGVARAFNWPGTALGPTFIARPLLILAAMAVFILAGLKPDAQTAMLAAILATYAATIGQLASLIMRLRREIPPGPSKYLPREWLQIALPIFLIEGFYNLLTNTDILFVSYYLPPDRVAIYFAAVKTLALVHFVYFAVKAASAHRFAAYYKAHDRTRYEEFINETVQWTFWPSLALAIVMVALGRYFLMLFGPSFLDGQSLLWILAIGVVVRASVGTAESVLTMSGEQRACALVYAASLFVNLTMNITLIPRYGLEGAAWATTFALVFEAAALYAVARRQLGVHIFIIPQGRFRNSSTGTAR